MELVTKTVASYFGRLQFPDRCVSVVTADTTTAHLSEVRQELSFCFASRLSFPIDVFVACTLHDTTKAVALLPKLTKAVAKFFENFNLL